MNDITLLYGKFITNLCVPKSYFDAILDGNKPENPFQTMMEQRRLITFLWVNLYDNTNSPALKYDLQKYKNRKLDRKSEPQTNWKFYG